jgi:nucleotide-binding universal stress UspA family protein
MNTIRKIIAGTDFNELATAAVRFGAVVAERMGAELIVVYADQFEPPAEFTKGQVQRIAESIRRSKARTREQLERYVAHNVPRNVKSRVVVAEGSPAAAISALAAAERAEFIMLGTHGRGGLQRLVMGSVAEAVIREATVPVMTLTSMSPPASVRRILCPVNDSALAAAAAERAAELAVSLGAELTLLQVGDTTPQFDPAALIRNAEVRPIVVRQESVAGAHPADGILELAESGAYDLMVIGAEHKLISDVTSFGTTAANFIRHSTIPVLTVTTWHETEARPGARGEIAHVL